MEFNAEEIRLLIIEKIAGTIEPADDAILEQLIKDDSRARVLWEEINQEVEAAKHNGFEIKVDEQQQWNQLYPQLEERSASTISILIKRFLVAASILVIVAMSYWWLNAEQPNAPLPAPTSLAAYNVKVPTLELSSKQRIELRENQSTKIGEAVVSVNDGTLTYTTDKNYRENWTLMIPPGFDYKVQLSDGTEIWLNAASSLSFPAVFAGDTRNVNFEGEAFFKVAKNKEKPFIAHASGTDVVVTGTEFNLNSYRPNNLQASLVEGSVTLRHAETSEVYLKPGLEAIYNNQKGFETHVFDADETLSWMKGIYYFRNTNLDELSSVIKRWYNVDSEFASNGLHAKTFSGELRKSQPLQAFLDNISESGDVRGELKNGRVQFR